jgi:DnaJ-domain-containing protein 1
VVDTESRQRIIEWDSRIDRLGYEELLGVPLDATRDACRQAYYRFAQSFHPDAHRDADPELRGALTRVFQRGVEAYRVLADPVLRARWVVAREKGELRLTQTTRAPEVNLEQELAELHIHCRSAGAKLFAKQAHSALGRANSHECMTHLRKALEYEGGANVYIGRCVQALEARGGVSE